MLIRELLSECVVIQTWMSMVYRINQNALIVSVSDMMAELLSSDLRKVVRPMKGTILIQDVGNGHITTSMLKL